MPKGPGETRLLTSLKKTKEDSYVTEDRRKQQGKGGGKSFPKSSVSKMCKKRNVTIVQRLTEKWHQTRKGEKKGLSFLHEREEEMNGLNH